MFLFVESNFSGFVEPFLVSDFDFSFSVSKKIVRFVESCMDYIFYPRSFIIIFYSDYVEFN